MGYQATCNCTLGKQASHGQSQLETDFIQFRAVEFRFRILLKDLTRVVPAGEFLEIESNGQTARLQLGEKVAAKWADKILNPPGRLVKLGVKPNSTVFLEGEFEAGFAQEVGSRAGSVAGADLIFLAARHKSTLLNVNALAGQMPTGAALWIVYPKGRTEIREMDVLNAGRSAGLKDVKVVRFSESETALKFVVPVSARGRP